jgi:hypothetical protein
MGSLARLEIQRLASVGAVSGGGGGAAPGIATIWPAVADWAALSTVAGPLRDGDQVGVSSLGSQASIGVALYDEANAEWALQFGMFASFADMTAFSEPIIAGALAGVQESANNDETAVRYQYESGWARTAVNQPYVWALSDLVTLDPSGIGVTRTGDVGVFGDWTYRLTAPLALPNGGSRAFWVPAEIYGRTPVVAGYADGSESVATVAAQGLTVLQSTGGTVSSLGTEHRFLAGGSAGGAAGFTFTAASANFYVRADIRAAFGSSGTWNGQVMIARGDRAFTIAQTQLTSTAVRSIDSAGNPIARLIRTEAFPGVASAHRTYENLSPNEVGYSAGDLLASGGTALTANLARVIVANGATPSSPATDFRTKNVLFMSYT